MLRYAICGLLVAAGVAASTSAAQTVKAEGCDGLPLFGATDSLNTPDLRVANKDLKVKVSAEGLELHLRLEPDSRWKPLANNGSSAGTELRRVGWIRVFSCDTGSLLQSLEAESSADPEMFVRFFEVKDVNFDGCLDIGVLREFGAKWGSQTWWMWDATSRRFVSNEFTKELGQVKSNGLVLDAARHNIIAGHMTDSTGCGATKDVYHVEQGPRLVPIHQEDISIGPDGCTLTTLDRVDGSMQRSGVRQFPSLAGSHP
jgi:hypothetical protein